MRKIKNNEQNILRSVVVPILGMSMFWPLFRYESFFKLLYPLESDISFGSFSISIYTVFLILLAAIVITFFAFQQRINCFIATRRIITTLIGALASLGAMIAYGILQTALPTGFICISVLLTILGFLMIFCAWASYFTEQFCASSPGKIITVLGSSFFLSYFLFSRHAFIGGIADGWFAAVIEPLGSALLWLASTPYPASRQTSKLEFMPRRFITPIIAVLTAFLLVGGTVRGIVDLYFPHTITQFSTQASIRFPLSLTLSAAIAIAGICLWLCSNSKIRSRIVQSNKTIVQFIDNPLQQVAIICWVIFSFIFLGGLFFFLIMDNKQIGGDIVVVSRSFMEFILWLLLCDRIAKRVVAPIPAFLAYYMSAEIISWALSYIVVPLTVSGTNKDGMLSADTFVLAVMFGIASAIIVFYGIYLALSQKHVSQGSWSNNAENNSTASTMMQSSRSDFEADIMQSLIAGKHLTTREATVALLYARGYSLGKVAEELSITKSTAQSHIKIVYRKLSVHSKDELIECLQEYNSEYMLD